VTAKRAVFLLLAAAGCNAAGEGEGAGVGTPAATTALGTAGPSHTVAWPAAAVLDRTAAARLSVRAAGVVKRSPVPALVPKDAALTPLLVATSGEHFFAFSVRHDGVTLSLHATARVAHTLPIESPNAGQPGSVPHLDAFPGSRAVRGVRGLVSQNEKIWTVTWIEGGVAYALDLECDDTRDRRCSDEAHLLDRVGGLAYVGGAGALREGGVK
jgi:hypothetical protein